MAELLLSGAARADALMPEWAQGLAGSCRSVDVRLPDHRARRADLGPRACSSASWPRPVGSRSAPLGVLVGGAACASSRRWADDHARSAGSSTGWRSLFLPDRRDERAAVPRELLPPAAAVAAGARHRARRARPVFGRTDELAGWTRPQLLVVMGVFTIVGGVIRFVIQPNMQPADRGRAPGNVRLRAHQARRRAAAGERARVPDLAARPTSSSAAACSSWGLVQLDDRRRVRRCRRVRPADRARRRDRSTASG